MAKNERVCFGHRCSALEFLGWICFLVGLALPADFSVVSLFLLGLALWWLRNH